MKRKITKKEMIVIFTIIIIIIMDQLTKIFLPRDINVIEGILRFTYTENEGGAFGILGSNTFTIILCNVILLAMILRFMIIQKERMDGKMLFSLTLILGGGLSNLIDRIFRGYVIDFIDVNPLFSFPMFNIADIVLVIGWIVLIITVLMNTIQIKR